MKNIYRHFSEETLESLFNSYAFIEDELAMKGFDDTAEYRKADSELEKIEEAMEYIKSRKEKDFIKEQDECDRYFREMR